MKTKSHTAIWRGTASVVLTLSLLFPTASASMAAVKVDTESGRIKQALDLLDQNHVSSPNRKQLTDVAIQAMVDSLKDPYTMYFSAEELKKFEGSLQNNYVGVGIKVIQQPEGVYVADVYEGPAQKAGMKQGDLIIAVNGESVAGQKIDVVTKQIMGPEGSTVSVTVQRAEASVVLDMSRQTIQLPVVTHKKFDSGVGYIRVASFSGDSDELTALHLAQLKKEGINSLILDLRDNLGGELDSAKNIAKLFVKEGTLIHTKNRDNVDDPVSFSGGTTQPFPVYILANEYSASASEVLTGALQDYNVVTKVIGKKTYGKGSVQTLFPLQNGGALKVTIEEYLTPKMRKVNNVGITPDIEMDGDVPQLITALHEAGVNNVTVALDKLGVKVNQLPVEDSLDVVRNDSLYVPSRLISSLLGGSISWNGEAQTVEITAAGATHSYQIATGDLLQKNGTTYVNMARAAEHFRQLSWSDIDQQFTVTASK